MSKFLKYAKPLLPFFLIFILLRLIFIFNYPPFTDESIYVNTGLVMVTSPENLWLSLSYWGKQPLPFWLFGFAGLIFKDPIIGARFLSLLLSLPTFFIVYDWLRRIKDEKTAKIGLFIFSFCPIFIFFQSTALMDGLVFSLTVIILWLLFLIWGKNNFKKSLLLGLLLGFSFWIKFNSVFIIILSFLSLTYFLFDKKRFNFKEVVFLLVPFLICLILIFPLITRSDFSSIFKENEKYTFSLRELMNFPFNFWLNNLRYTIFSLLIYLTPLLFFSLFFSYKNINRKQFTFLFFWFIFSLFFTILSAKIFRARYFLFSISALIPFLAIGTRSLIEKWNKQKININILFFAPLVILGLMLVFFPPVFFSLFPKNSIVSNERDYVFSWTSGYGVKEAIDFIENNRVKNSQIVIVVPNTASSVTDYTASYYRFKSNVKVLLVPIFSKKVFLELEPITKTVPTYFLVHNNAITSEIKPYLKTIKVFEKPNNEDSVGFYKIEF